MKKIGVASTDRDALIRALRIYDDCCAEFSFYVGHTAGRVGEQAHARMVEVCAKAAKAQAILNKHDPVSREKNK